MLMEKEEDVRGWGDTWPNKKILADLEKLVLEAM